MSVIDDSFKIKNLKVKYNEILYLLNEEKKTASVYKCNINKNKIFIPKSIIYNSKEYNITNFLRHSFYYSQIKSIELSKDSELETIDTESFYYSTVTSIEFPAKLKELKEGWCNYATKLQKIIVSPDNQYFKSLDDDKLVIGKTRIEQQNYDCLVFLSRFVNTFTIPSFIEHLCPYSLNSFKLQKVDFEKNSKLQTIGKNAFSHTSIKSITIPSEVKVIEKAAFIDSQELETIEIPVNSKLQSIGKMAFYMTQIKSIFIPSCVKELKNGCFGCSSINKVDISPDNKHYKIYDNKYIIGKTKNDNYDCIIYCFNNSEKVTIPNFIEHIYSFSFASYLIKTVEFEINSNLKTIGKYAFAATSIESISIPSSVREIKRLAFNNCHALESIEIPIDSKLRTIGRDSFCYSRLKSIYIPSDFEKFEEGWSKDASKLMKIEVSPNNQYFKSLDDGKLIVWKKTIDQPNYDCLVFCSHNVKKVIIPNYIEHICSYAFAYSQIEQVEFEMNSKLQTIDKYAFSNSSIKSITIPSEVTIIDEYSFNKCKQLQKVEIPNNSKLQTIEKESFAVTRIKSIKIPSQVTKIGEKAFSGCTFLETIEFENDSKLELIESNAFLDTSIKEFLIPSEVKEIGSYSLSSIKIPGQKVEFGSDSKLEIIDSFAFCNSLIESLTIPSHVMQLNSKWCRLTSRLNNISVSPDNQYFKTYNNNKMIIGKSMLNQSNFDCLVFCVRNIRIVKIPNFIEQICSCAFDNCSQIINVEFEKNSKLKLIQANAFNSSSIRSIVLPSGVTEILEEAFYGCKNLRYIGFEENSNVQMIHYNAFALLPLKSIYLPSNLKEIDNNAFNYCREIQIIEFHNKIEHIGFTFFEKAANSIFMIPANIQIL